MAGRKDEETSAHPGEKFDTPAGKRNPGAPINRGTLRDLELPTSCLSWVRRESHAQFFGEGVVAIPPPYPTTYQVHPNAGAGEVEVMEYQQEMGHFAIDSSADMVIGHHSHQPQPMEVYQGKPILYSLANFVHDLAGFRGQTLMAILVRCLISDGKIQRLSYVPGIIRGHRPPDFARPTQVPEVVQRLSDMSSPFGTRFEVGEEAVALALEPAT